jgi:hypothetical protein
LAAKFKIPQEVGAQPPFINPRFRLSDFAQAHMMPVNLDHIGISMLPPAKARIESVESETQTTPQKMSFGMPTQQDEDLNQNKFFHSVEKEYMRETLRSPCAFDQQTISQPERPQSVPMCSNPVTHFVGDNKRQVVPDFQVQKFQLADQAREPEAHSSQRMLQQVLKSRCMAPTLPHNDG